MYQIYLVLCKNQTSCSFTDPDRALAKLATGHAVGRILLVSPTMHRSTSAIRHSMVDRPSNKIFKSTKGISAIIILVKCSPQGTGQTNWVYRNVEQVRVYQNCKFCNVFFMTPGAGVLVPGVAM